MKNKLGALLFVSGLLVMRLFARYRLTVNIDDSFRR